ncbi:MAG: hypothetical protein LBT79_04060 [Elusimicrobiota bacterium]|nr:hypothetical protein [Elusimicrobiota bacterium]
MSTIFKLIKLAPALAAFLPKLLVFADNVITVEKMRRKNKKLKLKLVIVSIAAAIFFITSIVFLLLWIYK